MQSIETGGRLLSALADASGAAMLRDLAAAARLTPAQAHAYLVSLRKVGLVEQDAASGRYRLGPFALRLGLARMRVSDPLRAAGDGLGELADRLGLMLSIAVWGDMGPTVVRVHEAVTQIHANVRPGTVFSLFGTATGRVFAAHLADALVARRLAAELADTRHAPAAPPGLAAIRADAAAIRARGCAVTVGVPVPGVSAICAPVFDHGGQIQLAVTAMGPSGAVDVAAGSAQETELLRFTRDLSAQFGFAGPQPRQTDR